MALELFLFLYKDKILYKVAKMNAKFLRIIACFFLLIYGVLNSQTITFENTYPQLGEEVKGHSIYQTQDGGYVAGGYRSSYMLIVNFDEFGSLEWSQEIETDHFLAGDLRTHLISPVSDEGIIAVSTKIESDKESIYLLKFNSNGDTLWTKVYPSGKEEYGCAVLQTDDGGYLVLGGERRFSFSSRLKKAKLIKTDSLGNQIWMEKYFINSGYFQGYSLAQFSDGSLLIGGKKDIVKLNSSGDSLWTKTFGYNIIAVNTTDDDKIII